MAFDSENYSSSVDEKAFYESCRMDAIPCIDVDSILFNLRELLETRKEVAGIISREYRKDQKEQAQQVFDKIECDIKKMLALS